MSCCVRPNGWVTRPWCLPVRRQSLPAAPLAADDAGQTQQVEVQGEDVAISSTSSMQSLLGKRNLLRSRLRGEQSANAVPARITPVKSVAATKPAPAMPAVATSPQAEVQPAARPEMPGRDLPCKQGMTTCPSMPMKRGQ